MLYLISGATAAGKSTVSRLLSERVSNLVWFEEDRRHPKTTGERFDNLDLWIGDALEAEAHGRDVVFGSQSPLGEFLASPRAVELEGIAPCLLDVHDVERVARWRARGMDEEWPMVMDHFCWAAFHRLHARDPRFEARVLVDRDPDGPAWSRWTGWTADDLRWSVFIHDSTAVDVEATVDAVASWIEGVRRGGTPLSRKDRWWE